MSHTGKLKSNFHLLSNPSELVNMIGSNKVASPVFDKLTNVLWTLLQTIISTNRGSKVALIQWNPIGHDIVELGKKNQLPVFKLPHKKAARVPSNHWPPSKPTVVEADIGAENGPMMLSELVVDDEWRSPAIIRKFNDPNKDFTTVESKCHATKEFEKVRGTNRWCSLNCNAGNCPPIMCTCTKQRISKTKTKLQPRGNPIISKPLNKKILLRNHLNHNSINLKPKAIGLKNHKLLRIFPNRKKIFPNAIKQSHAFKRTLKKTARLRCRGAGKFAARPKMVVWCLENCSKGFCPKSICTCTNSL
jgi:hypothetical protein